MSDGKTYTEHIKFVEQKLDKLADSFDQFAKDQKSETQSIKQLLAGSEFGEDGLIAKVMKQDKRIEELEDFKNKILGYIVGGGLASGTAASVVFNLLS